MPDVLLKVNAPRHNSPVCRRRVGPKPWSGPPRQDISDSICGCADRVQIGDDDATYGVQHARHGPDRSARMDDALHAMPGAGGRRAMRPRDGRLDAFAATSSVASR
ncbi:MAG TPA: hypothetical protein VGD37_21115 [Kofleriaceae bacterium]|jgi:hypothetical protein